jgi:cysteinyl-tRNA synthetase
MDLTWDSIAAANSTLKRWRRSGYGKAVNFGSDLPTLEALNNDLDTPRVMQRLRSVEKDASLSDAEKAAIFTFADQVLALDLGRDLIVPELPAELSQLLAEREVARSTKNWSESDRLRMQLESAGLVINDTADGQEWDLR